MDLSKIPLFNMMATRLSWLSQRQGVLAQNIANANTPGYKPQDLKEPDFQMLLRRSMGGSLDLAKTRGVHLSGTAGGGGKFKAIEVAGAETTPMGNAVVLEEQLIKTAETRMQYTTTLNLYRKHVNMIKAALGGGR